MPPNFCLLPKVADDFLARVKSGALDPALLATMSSAERRAALAEVVGAANAEHVNASFESKLLLKNQQQGLQTWVEKTGGLKPEVKRDMLARIERMERVLEPADLQSFKADLAKQKLGFGVSMEEAGRISQLAKTVSEHKAAAQFDPKTGEALGGEAARMAYGKARVEFGNYVADLANENAPTVLKSLATAVDGTLSRSERVEAATSAGKQFLSELPGFSKSIKASFDNSSLLRQGWKNLFAHPEIWLKNSRQSFVDIAEQFGGKEVMNEVNAEILSRPNAMNGRYKKANLALANIEEAFPSSLPEKIPGLGRAFKASEAAFTAFQYRMRADVFDKYMDIAERSGVDLSDPRELESIGKLVNSLTARGHLGSKLEPAAPVVNSVFFSGRKLMSDVDFLTAHQFESGVTPFVRKQAAVNLLKVVSGTAAILTVADAVAPGSVEWDPRSSDFGKIKVKGTRFDVTGGMGSVTTLAARLASMSSKSTATGEVTALNDGGFKSKTGFDVLVNFFENKLSPAASVAKDLLKGQDFEGKKPTLGGELTNLFAPLPATNTMELLTNPDAANPLAATIADALGISVNTYSPKPPKEKKPRKKKKDAPSDAKP